MPCVTQSCQQGRADCETPFVCGRRIGVYASPDAKQNIVKGCVYIDEPGLHRHDGPFHHHEPVPAQEELFTWLDGLFASAQRILAGACIVAAVIALVIWLASTWPVAYAVAVLME